MVTATDAFAYLTTGFFLIYSLVCFLTKFLGEIGFGLRLPRDLSGEEVSFLLAQLLIKFLVLVADTSGLFSMSVTLISSERIFYNTLGLAFSTSLSLSKSSK